MKMKDSIDCAEQLLLKTYNRYQVGLRYNRDTEEKA